MFGQLPSSAQLRLPCYVLDPNLEPVAPPLIRFENGVLGIVGITAVVCLAPLALISKSCEITYGG